jgi:hypothetical protein
MEKCPTKFDPIGVNKCIMIGGQYEIVIYNFNYPVITFENTGTAGTALDLAAVNVIAVANSAYPVKNRGLFFDGASDAYIMLPTLILSHSMSVHVWLLRMGTAKVAVFSKDRDDFTAATDAQLLYFSISATNNLEAMLAKDHNTLDYRGHTSTATITADVWEYVVYSIKMLDGADTDFEFFINEVSDGTNT